MTVDKFGRHLVKYANKTQNNVNETIEISNYLFYNVILQFESNTIENNKFILKTGKPYYAFPLEQGAIQKVLINISNISIAVNDKELSGEQLNNFFLNKEDRISFIGNTQEKLKNLFVEIIVKCPINFENDLVESEKAYYKH